MLALLALFIGLQSGGDIESLVRDLGHENIETREKAQRDLLKIGEVSLPALRRAVKEDSDPEQRARAWALILRLDRVEREREHDARELRDLLAKLHPDFLESWKDKPHRYEGAYFSVTANSTRHGLVIWTDPQNLLMRYEGGKRGGLALDIESLVDECGKKIEFEHCFTCNRVLAKSPASGPLKMRVTGNQTWFSRYRLEFANPRDGATQQVGTMTIAIAWPEVIIRSKDGWPANTGAVRNGGFDFELRPDSGVAKSPRRGFGEVVGMRCGAGGLRPAPAGWCQCLDGPKVVDSPRKLPSTDEIRLKSNTDGIPLETVSVIRCDVWKPMTIPIDFTAEVKPRPEQE